MIHLTLLGCGGTMPLSGRHLTALHASLNGSSLLIDCGEATQIAFREQKLSFFDIDTICFTHYHADHIAGLPGLLLSLGLAGRSAPVTLVGPEGLIRTVNGLRTIAPELPFELRFHELRDPEETFTSQDFNITAFQVNHSMPCYGFSIERKRAGKFDTARAKAQGIPVPFWKRLQNGEEIEWEGRILTPSDVLGAERRGIHFVYCTDTRPIDSLPRYAYHADLLIAEGMYAEPDKQESAVSKKHMTFAETAGMAARAQCSELWLTHYSPALPDPEPYIDPVRSIFPQTYAGYDGKSIELNFRD